MPLPPQDPGKFHGGRRPVSLCRYLTFQHGNFSPLSLEWSLLLVPQGQAAGVVNGNGAVEGQGDQEPCELKYGIG